MRTRFSGTRLAAGRLSLALILALFAQGEGRAEEVAGEGVRPLGPLDVQAQLEENAREKESAFDFPWFDQALSPWYGWKEQFAEKTGLSLGADYQVVGQVATDSLGDDSAVGGVARFFGTWALFGRGTNHPGSLVFRLESRDRIGTDLNPEDLGPVSLGYAGLTAADFSDIGFGVPELYWKQQFLGEHPVEIRVGRLAPVGFFDVTPFSDNLTGFMNLSMIFSPTVPYPSAGTMGAVGYVGVTKNIYVLGTIVDANGEWDGGGSIGDGEFFKGVEVGWTDQNTGGFHLMDNYHISYWHKDELDDSGTPSGQGISVAASRWCEPGRWGIFARAGWADRAALLEWSATLGVTANLTDRDDYAGMAVSWGRAFDSSEDQISTELFYRWQLAQNLALTPSVQLLFNPALNPEDDFSAVFGLRLRTTF